jgi:hypothetical protein
VQDMHQLMRSVGSTEGEIRNNDFYNFLQFDPGHMYVFHIEAHFCVRKFQHYVLP